MRHRQQALPGKTTGHRKGGILRFLYHLFDKVGCVLGVSQSRDPFHAGHDNKYLCMFGKANGFRKLDLSILDGGFVKPRRNGCARYL